MLRFVFATAFAFAAGAAIAAPMPKLPDNLPPLPTTYIGVGGWSGAYAGLLTGVITQEGLTPTLAAVVGYDFETDALVGVEAQVTLSTDGEVSLAGLGRLGLTSDNFAFYGLAGAGLASDNGAFGLIGAGLELAFADAWRVRVEYQRAYDLSSDAQHGSTLVGLTYRF